VGLLLDHLGFPAQAAKVEAAVAADIASRGSTPRSTREVGEALAAAATA
jgi:3-isopropylmalate dehydrogenase